MSEALAVALLVLLGELRPDTVGAWESYVGRTEHRIEAELGSPSSFLMLDSLPASDRGRCDAQLRSGKACILKRETRTAEGKAIRVPDGMIHHWYGSVFVPGAKLETVLEWVTSYDDREKFYSEVEDSRLIERNGDAYRIFLRLKRTKVLTAHYNTEHDVTYRRHDRSRVSSRSVATRIRELDHPGEPRESEKEPDDDRGFLWRLNSYWRFQEKDGGTYVECESISLSRSPPPGVDWMMTGFIESVPRESLESTLLPIRTNLSK